ncbi:MAG: Adenosyl-chloride synthase [Syntrophus sp. PtaB.Bin001]|nr:MAG: Adenosyl-chloride synthase [Syntrophus sp. PtaB.Bin001]
MSDIGPSVPLITLLTDFGLRDVYAGIMKGVIAGISSAVKVIDITHEIPPQDIRAASFCLMAAYPYFPQGTIHVVVVDPGVGTTRRAVAVELEEAVLVGPDNGVFTGILEHKRVKAAVELTCTEFWLSKNPGYTFHGRDIFAPVAAHLASGISLSMMGPPIDPAELIRFEIPSWKETDDGFFGVIQYIDYFGNLVTNIPGCCVEGQIWSVEVADREIPGGKTYGNVACGFPSAFVGSHGFVEIGVNGGSAKTMFSMNVEDHVQVIIKERKS